MKGRLWTRDFKHVIFWRGLFQGEFSPQITRTGPILALISCDLISKMIFSLQNVSPWNKLVSRLHWFRFREFLINYKRHYIKLIPVKLREVSSYFLFIRDCFKGRYVQRNMIKIRNYSDATHDFGNFSDFSDWFENFIKIQDKGDLTFHILEKRLI